MNGSFYSEGVMKHIRRPQNMGEMKNPDGVGTAGNPVCGDRMRIFIKVGKRAGKEYIRDIKFQTLGCGAAIATSSMMTSMVKGKPLAEARKVTNKVVAEALGGLPVPKLHCSLLAEKVVKKAIDDYLSKKSVPTTKK